MIIFCLPFTPAGVPWRDEFDWRYVNYAPITVGVVLLIVGLWWTVQRQAHVQGPGAHGRVRRGRRGPGVSKRPVIGLCAAVERARWSVWDDEAVLLPRSYATPCSARAGWRSCCRPTRSRPGEWLALLDGLILAGGADYGEVPDRDAFEIALGLAAMERDLPLLGVCRGMQLMNLARGGTLIEHLPDVLGHEDHRLVPGAFGDHDVRLAEGSLAARAAGELTHADQVAPSSRRGCDRRRVRGDGLGVGGRAAGSDRGPDRGGSRSASSGIRRPTRRRSRSRRWSRRRGMTAA